MFPEHYVMGRVWCTNRCGLVCFQRSFLQQAVVKDFEGKVGVALSLYCSGLDYLLPAMKCKSRV